MIKHIIVVILCIVSCTSFAMELDLVVPNKEGFVALLTQYKLKKFANNTTIVSDLAGKTTSLFVFDIAFGFAAKDYEDHLKLPSAYKATQLMGRRLTEKEVGAFYSLDKGVFIGYKCKFLDAVGALYLKTMESKAPLCDLSLLIKQKKD